jgi:lipopolysaccharide assembly protein A
MTHGPASANRTASPSSSATRSRKAIGRVLAAHWLALVLVVVAAVFIGQNRQQVTINLFTAEFNSPMWLILLITILVGLIIGALATRQRRHRRERRGLPRDVPLSFRVRAGTCFENGQVVERAWPGYFSSEVQQPQRTQLTVANPC